MLGVVGSGLPAVVVFAPTNVFECFDKCMDGSIAGSLIGLVMSPMMLLLLYVAIKGAASEPVDRFGMTGIRIQATQRSDAAWLAGHRAALPIAKKALSAVLVVDALCGVLLFVGPTWCRSWLGFVPVIALLVAMVPVVQAAMKAANAAP